MPTEEVTELPIVTYNSARPDEVFISLTTEKGTIHYRMDAWKGLRLRFMLGRALHPGDGEKPSDPSS